MIILKNGDIRGRKFNEWYYKEIEKVSKFDIFSQKFFFLILLILVGLYLIKAPRIAFFEMMSGPGNYLGLEMAREESMKLAGFGYLTYIFEWMRNIFFPLLFSWSYFSSGFSKRTILIFITAVFYSVLTISKEPIAMLLLCFFISYALKNKKPLLSMKLLLFGLAVVLSVLLIIVITINISQSLNLNFIAILFISILNRIFIVTSEIPYYWIVYFPDIHGSFLFGASNSIYSKLIGIDFVPASNLVYNYIYPGRLESGLANAAFFADAYANFGFLGVIIISWLVGLTLALVHFHFININKSAFIAACYVCLYIIFLHLLSTSFTTTILTGGIIIIFLLKLIFNISKRTTYLFQNREFSA